jgi:hypothetical protein
LRDIRLGDRTLRLALGPVRLFREDGRLYCVALDEVVAFDFDTAKCLGAVVQMAQLNGQALAFFP